MLIISLHRHKNSRMNLHNNHMNKIILDRMKVEITKINIMRKVLKHSHQNDKTYFRKSSQINIHQRERIIIIIIAQLINKTKINH